MYVLIIVIMLGVLVVCQKSCLCQDLRNVSAGIVAFDRNMLQWYRLYCVRTFH